MNKIPHRLRYFIVPAACALLFLYSCAETFIPNEAFIEENIPLSQKFGIGDARIFFEAFRGEASITRTAGENIFPDPRWEGAAYSEFLGHEVIDIPFDNINCASYRHTGRGTLANKHPKPPYNTSVRLLSGLNKWGEIYYRVVYIIPEPSFFEKNGIRPGEVALDHTREDFSGTMLLFEITGEFVKSFTLAEGKIIRSSLSSGTVNTRSRGNGAPATRSNECTEVEESFWIDWVDNCYDEEFGGWITCVKTRKITFIYEECIYGGNENTGNDTDPATGGDTGNTSSSTPKTDKVINNTSLTEQEKAKLEELIIEMINDCIGKAIYNALASGRDGNKLNFVTDPSLGNGGIYDSDGIIILGHLDGNDDRLFHEMWHAYQQMQGEDMSVKDLNLEIEAQLSHYLYLRRQYLMFDDSNPATKYFNKTREGRSVRDLSYYFNGNGSLRNSINDSEFENLLSNVFNIFKNGTYYNNYTHDISRTGIDNFTNLIDLSQLITDCFNFYSIIL